MLRKLATLLLAALLTGCFALSPEVQDPAPESELKKVAAKFDKVNNPGKVQCRTYYSKLSASATNMQIQILMETYADLAKNRIRTTITIPGMPKQVELYDGQKGYNIIPGMQTKVQTGDKLAFLRYSAKHTKPWSCLSSEYEKLQLDKNLVSINGRSCYRLVGQPAGEPTLLPVELFIDSKTFYPVRTRSIVPSDLGKVPNQLDYLKFKKYSGALVGQTVQLQQLQITLKVEMQELKLNCPIPDTIFDAEAIADEED